MTNKIFTWLFAIICILLVIVGVLFWRGAFSRSDVKMEIIGPSEVIAGEEVEYIVKFKNNSNASLESIRLSVEFPSHTTMDDELARVFLKDEEEIGTLYPGEEKNFKFKIRMFGNKGDAREISALLMYQPKGLKARYPSKIQSIVVIKEGAVDLEFDAKTSIETGKELDLVLNYYSNADYSLEDVKIELVYPSNFEFTTAYPSPQGSNYWTIKDLNPGEGGRIRIKGFLNGDIGDKKEFGAKIGFVNHGEFVALNEASFSVGLEEPDLLITQKVNGSERYAVSLGEEIEYEINFRNVGNTPFRDLFAAVRLSGDLFDLSTLKVEKGDVDSSAKTVMWDSSEVSMLKLLAPGEQGTVKFKVKIEEEIPREFLNPGLISKVIIGQTQKEFITRINSKLGLKQSLQINDDIFLSPGPVPLQVQRPSIVTVFWDIKNYFNDAENVEVTAILPDNVEFLGKISPDEQKGNITINGDQIKWEAGTVSAGTGIMSKREIVAFQVKITPFGMDKDKYMVVLENVSIKGKDIYTNNNIQSNVSDLESSSLGEVAGKVK